MFDQRVIISQQFPILQKARRHTDFCCTVIAALIALTLFITALIVYSPEKYQERFKSVDINSCKAGYLHYPDVKNNINKVCLNACPQGYGATQDRLCIPENSKLQEEYYKNTGIMKTKDAQGFKKSIIYAFIVALGMAIVWMVFVFILPKFTPIAAGIGAIIFLVFIAIFSAFSTQNFWGPSSGVKIITIIICVILIAIIGAILFLYEGSLKFQSIFLKYSNIFLFQNELTFLYIPIFMIFTFAFLLLIWFQNMAFQSKFATNNDPWNYNNSGALGVLNILELIWGLQFLRDSFNFCVSGNAVDWYWNSKTQTFAPMMRLLCRHWGSVVGGSFLNAFFEIPTFIVELLVCHPEACLSKAGTFCRNVCNPFTCFFEIVRTDAYSYINLSGIPFCNSARNCSHLCENSRLFIGSQSPMRHYRLIASIFLVSMLSFMTQFILNYQTFTISFWNLAIGVIVIYMTIHWFVDIHAASAQGLQTSFLAEFQLQQGYKHMRKIRPSIKGQLQFLDSQQKIDGTC